MDVPLPNKPATASESTPDCDYYGQALAQLHARIASHRNVRYEYPMGLGTGRFHHNLCKRLGSNPVDCIGTRLAS